MLNIAVVAAMGALILFFFVSTIVVAAKGKRKCNAFDVIIRILSTLVMLASEAMFACAVLTMLTGKLCIAVTETTATMTAWGKTFELPVPDLFILLSTTLGSDLAAALLLCSLAVLIVDCLVANKKEKKNKNEKKAKGGESKKAQSPEEIKRRAELEKIRRIGESAVQKTSAVAEKNAAANVKAEGGDEIVSQPDSAADEPEFDWRTADKEQEQKPTEFVGIKDAPAADDSFDDNFDDSFDVDGGEDGAVPEADDGAAYNASEEDTAFFVDAEESSPTDGISDEQIIEEHPTDEKGDEFESYAEPTEESFDEPVADGDESEQAISDEPFSDDFGTEPEPQAEETPDEELTERAADELVGEEDIDEIADEPKASAEPERNENIEPDRDIYIPEIRTVTRNTASTKPSRTPASRTGKGSAKKPQASAGKASAQKRTASASPKKPSTTVGASATKPKSASASKTATKPQDKKIPAEKKLPVTRRYVILDRRSAVNMFGEYLKERDKQSKDKLEKSINTIIIE